MSEFKETTSSEKIKETDQPIARESDIPRLPSDAELKDEPYLDLSDILVEAFKQFSLTEDASEEKESDINGSSEGNAYSDYLEKGDDSKYYDKETGKAYDSVEDWVKAQETLAKRYEGAAKYFEDKAKKEWAKFKNAEENGESDAEKWEHYRRSQEYYAKAKECNEKAEHIREKLGQSEKADCVDDETDMDDNGKDDYGKAYRNGRGEFLPNNIFTLMGYEYETDKNGNICKADSKEIPNEHKDDNRKTYRNPDGGYIPNNTFDLDGHTYETDDIGNICKIDGEEVPESCKDEFGSVYRNPDGKLIPNNSYLLDGILYEEDRTSNQ